MDNIYIVKFKEYHHTATGHTTTETLKPALGYGTKEQMKKVVDKLNHDTWEGIWLLEEIKPNKPIA